MNLENELLENQLIENFQVEELEKRFEMGWIRPPDYILYDEFGNPIGGGWDYDLSAG
jgi:hypothetical protein